MAQTTINPARATEKFSKSVGGSLKSLMGAKGRKYFILEYVTSSEKHRAGETTEFIGDYVELGRGNQYAVNFGDDCPTVSRPHAAIIRTDDGWVLKNLSAKNPTLINRNPVRDQSSLKNGDEIQLSYEGPKMSFLVPANNSVASMGMTARMKAVVNEAVRPYKKTLSLVLLVFLLITGGLVYYMNDQHGYYNNLLTKMEKTSQSERDSIIAKNEKMESEFQAKFFKLIKENRIPGGNNASLQGGRGNQVGQSGQGQGGQSGQGAAASSNLQGLYGSVYFIKTDRVVVEFNGKTVESKYGITATGFLLKDGSFVTARHVVEPWFFLDKNSGDEEKGFNMILSNGGKVTHYFTAYSPAGGSISFKSTDFAVDRSQDVVNKVTMEDSTQMLVTIGTGSLENGKDWAVAKTDSKNGLAFNTELSHSLTAATKLYVLGYPWGMGVNNSSDFKPLYNECQVARDGLDNGKIDISSRGFDHGNSGGPVFALVDNQYYVVGIVSAEVGAQGYFVPLSSIH